MLDALDAWTTLPRRVSSTIINSSDSLLVLHEASSYPNVPSPTITDESLSPEARSLLERTSWDIDPCYVVHLPGGIITQGHIPVSQNRIVYHDLATHAGRHILPSFITTDSNGTKKASITLPEPKQMKGVAVQLFFSHACGFNHSHWLLQTLPKIRMFESLQICPDYYLVTQTIRDYQRDTLYALGIKSDQIIVVDQAQTLQFDHLFVAYTGNDLYPDLSIYDRLALTTTTSKHPDHERIYVSRKDARVFRRFLNEDEIIAVAEKHNFKVIMPSTLSFADEILYFRNAKIIAGPIGAGLYNALFTQKPASIIALSDPAYVMDWPLQMASLKKHRIAHILGNSFRSYEPIHRGTHNSWVLSPQHFESAIEKFSS